MNKLAKGKERERENIFLITIIISYEEDDSETEINDGVSFIRIRARR